MDGAWSCEGHISSNYHAHGDGNPTEISELADNEDLTRLSYSLEALGRHAFDKDFVRWSGDATDPNNEPTEVSYRVKGIEMDLYYFSMYEGDQWSRKDASW